MSQKTVQPCIARRKLKELPWPDEEVFVRFNRWRKYRRGNIVKDQYGYNFIDEKGVSYQCHPGYDPTDVKVARTGEEWCCYE